MYLYKAFSLFSIVYGCKFIAYQLFGFEYVTVDLFSITKEKSSHIVIIARNALLGFFWKFHTPKGLNFAEFHL